MTEPPPARAPQPQPPRPVPPILDPALLDAQECVAVDRACVKCGYNVRTLHISANCPECGHPVATAVRQVWLEYADGGWLATVRRGAAFLAGAHGLTLVALALAALAGLAEWNVGPLRSSTSSSNIRRVELAALASLLTGLIGALLLTAVPRSVDRGQMPERRRRTIRWQIAAALFCIGLLLATLDHSGILAFALVLPPILAFALLLYQIPAYVADLLRFTDDRRGVIWAGLAGVARIGLWLLGIGLVLNAASNEASELSTLVLLIVITALVECAYIICYCRLWHTCGRLIRAQRATATATSVRNTPAPKDDGDHG